MSYTINPETAAHNVAQIFSKYYVDSLSEPLVIDSESKDLYSMPKKVAQIYALAYDTAYEYIANQNQDSE